MAMEKKMVFFFSTTFLIPGGGPCLYFQASLKPLYFQNGSICGRTLPSPFSGSPNAFRKPQTASQGLARGGSSTEDRGGNGREGTGNTPFEPGFWVVKLVTLCHLLRTRISTSFTCTICDKCHQYSSVIRHYVSRNLMIL